jgi:hypothetical protein
VHQGGDVAFSRSAELDLIAPRLMLIDNSRGQLDTGRKGKNVRTINLCTQPFELLDNRKANIRQSVSPMAELHPALTGHRIPGAELALASL